MVQSSDIAIDKVWLLGVSGAVTVTGYFCDEQGNRIGNPFTGTVPVGDGVNDPVSFATIAGIAIPSNAAGARTRQSGDMYVDAFASASAAFKANYALFPVAAAETEYKPFGRVK